MSVGCDKALRYASEQWGCRDGSPVGEEGQRLWYAADSGRNGPPLEGESRVQQYRLEALELRANEGGEVGEGLYPVTEQGPIRMLVVPALDMDASQCLVGDHCCLVVDFVREVSLF